MDTTATQLAKLTKPRFQRVLPRQRLFRLLNNSRAFPAIWVSGPAGSGKTTLVASYIEENKLPHLWYQLEENDSDPANFFYYLRLAGQKISARTASSLPLLTPEYGLGLSEFTRRFFENLYAGAAEPGVFVFDNYQEVPGESFHGVMREALSVIPEGFNVFILSRTEPPPVFSRIIVRGILADLGWKDLRCQPDETQSLIRLITHEECPVELGERLYKKTEGWIAGVILMLKHMDIREIQAGAFEPLAEESVFDYFASEIFEATGPGIQHFLLRTSLFPSMTEQMAEMLTGEKRAASLLYRMSREHWFTERHPASPSKYQYHPLFREFLLKRAAIAYSAEYICRLKKKAAGILETDGQIESAVGLLLESGSHSKALELILGHAQAMVLQGRVQTLDAWLQRISEEKACEQPWVLYWRGNCLLQNEPLEAERLFENAMASFEAKGDPIGRIMSLCGVFDSITYGFQGFKHFDKWFPSLERLSGEYEMLPSPEIKGKVTFSVLHALTLRQPEHSEFKIWEKRGLGVIQSNVKADIKIQVLLPLILHRIFAGDLAEADYYIRTYRELAKIPNARPLAIITLRDLEAFYYWYTGSFEECRRVVAEGLELASSTGVHIMTPYLLAHGAAGALSTADSAQAAEWLQSMEPQIVFAPTWVKELYHALNLWESLLKKNPHEAIFHGESTVKLAEDSGCPLSASFEYLGLALALHLSKRAGEASTRLQQAFALSRRIGSHQIEFTCYLAEAEMAIDSGEQAVARVSLQKAMAIGAEYRYVNTWFWRPETMTRLCSKALEENIEVDYVQYLIRCRGLMPESPPLNIEHWPWAIRIYALGRFTIIKDGRRLQMLPKAQEKPIALLKTIIEMGGRNVSENRIADRLWPEADGDAARGAFKTTLHRLRKLLGHYEAIHRKAGEISLDHRYCWVDAWAFERMLSEAEAIWQTAENENDCLRAARLTEKALGLYTGQLFHSEDDRAIPLRDHLHHRFIRALQQMANFWQGLEEWGKALSLYEKGLKIDALVEPFYRGLIVCNQRMGHKAKALAAYSRCKEVMTEDLGVSPSPETEALKKFLLNQ